MWKDSRRVESWHSERERPRSGRLLSNVTTYLPCRFLPLTMLVSSSMPTVQIVIGKGHQKNDDRAKMSVIT